MADIRSYYSDPSLFQYSVFISFDPPFVYINNAKCGCTTTKASINRWHAAWHGETLNYSSLGEIHSRIFNRLLTPNQVGAKADDIITRDPSFFRFTLFRDPLSRLASAYMSKLSWGAPERQMFNRLAGRRIDEPIAFGDFLTLIHANSTLRDKNEHWRPQVLQIAAPEISYDRICLFDTLERDLLALRDRIFPGVSLGVFETRRHFPENQSASSRLLKSLTTEQIEMIKDTYAEDFKIYDTLVRDAGGTPVGLVPIGKSADRLRLPRILARFESLGDNCEFAFFQRAFGVETSGLMRWTYALLPSFLKALQGNLEGLFEFSNLVPHAANMVEDTKYGICFHSLMKTDGKQFLIDEAARRAVYPAELSKIEHMKERLLSRMKDSSVILVYKCNENVSDLNAEALLSALAALGTAKLLLVRTGRNPGNVRRIDDRLMIGEIDRFAPYDSAQDLSLDAWSRVALAADALCPIA